MTKKILIINGPNLNLLGDREKSKYGNDTLEMVRKKCESHAKLINAEIKFKQSNKSVAFLLGNESVNIENGSHVRLSTSFVLYDLICVIEIP